MAGVLVSGPRSLLQNEPCRSHRPTLMSLRCGAKPLTASPSVPSALLEHSSCGPWAYSRDLLRRYGRCAQTGVRFATGTGPGYNQPAPGLPLALQHRVCVRYDTSTRPDMSRKIGENARSVSDIGFHSSAIAAQSRTCKIRMRFTAQRPAKLGGRKAVVVVSNLANYSHRPHRIP